jgi:hypothetical protein
MGVERVHSEFKGCISDVARISWEQVFQTLRDDRVLMLLDDIASFANFSNARDGSRETTALVKPQAFVIRSLQ